MENRKVFYLHFYGMMVVVCNGGRIMKKIIVSVIIASVIAIIVMVFIGLGIKRCQMDFAT